MMYLMVATRPDLAFAFGKLSRFVSCYGKEHWAAIKRVLRYVKGSMEKELVFEKSAACVQKGYSDAEWAGDHETRRSTTGFEHKRTKYIDICYHFVMLTTRPGATMSLAAGA